MTKHIALLRGINVSGKNKIKMADLKQALSNGELKGVQTYIQSGNIVFESGRTEDQSAQLIEEIIKAKFGFEVPTLVLSQDKMTSVLKANPFSGKVGDTKMLYFCFMLDEIKEERLEVLEAADLKGDEYNIIDDVIYTCYHNGLGKAKMDNNFLESKLKVRATTRNWNTVKVLCDM